jgi:flagellar hook-basal body complex protein FliE
VTELHEVSTVGTNASTSLGISANVIHGSGKPSGIGGTPFGDLLTDAIGKVNQLEDQARTAVDGFMTGKGVDVHEVMIASEKASMAFEMALALRNKAVQSYQTVMSMQF